MSELVFGNVESAREVCAKDLTIRGGWGKGETRKTSVHAWRMERLLGKAEESVGREL